LPCSFEGPIIKQIVGKKSNDHSKEKQIVVTPIIPNILKILKKVLKKIN